MFIGQTVERQVVFRDHDGNLINPDVVNANTKDPQGNSRVGTTNNQSLGVWDGLFATDLVGIWFWRIEGEGPGDFNQIYEGSFCVQASSVE